jgi:hypothetical protein
MKPAKMRLGQHVTIRRQRGVEEHIHFERTAGSRPVRTSPAVHRREDPFRVRREGAVCARNLQIGAQRQYSSIDQVKLSHVLLDFIAKTGNVNVASEQMTAR